MRSAIVFGSNGYLGRHICLYLKNNHIDFTPIGKSEQSIDNYPNYLSVDITYSEQLNKIDFNVDVIFMFAGLTGTKNDESTIEKFTKVNEVGLQNIIDCIANKNESPKVVFPSSRLVYKGRKGTLLVENSEKEMKTIYAQNKLNCEQILIDSHNKYNINFTIFRVCVPYGNSFEDGYSYGTIGFFIGRAKSGENITLYGDGELKRTFTHVDDLSRIIVESSFNKNTDNQIFNIGSNDNLSLKEVAKLIADKYSVGITYVPWPEEALEVESGDTMFNDDKIRNSLNVSYKNSIKTSFLPHNKIER